MRRLIAFGVEMGPKESKFWVVSYFGQSHASNLLGCEGSVE